jgi:hypothetical protein
MKHAAAGIRRGELNECRKLLLDEQNGDHI